MKVSIINQSDINGGAARAAYRLHQALLVQGIDSRMYVNQAIAGDWTVNVPEKKIQKIADIVRIPLGILFTKLLKTENSVLHSPAFIPSHWPKIMNLTNPDVVNLHWLGGEMMSIEDIKKIKKPIVWTLHDMWAFCGAEHVSIDNRWRDGYTTMNRPSHETAFDLNKWTWNRKRSHWKRPMHIVTPSRWLADCVKQSKLMHDWPVTVVPNPIDTERWMPIEKELARKLIRLPPQCPIIAFGTFGANAAPHKGFDLLKSALNNLRGKIKGLELLVFGCLAPPIPDDLGFPIHYTGHLHDDLSLRLLYSAIDAMVIPSRQDNLPNCGVEAHSCGTPIIAFNIGGLPDIVDNKKTGYLANAFDVEEFAEGILWVLEDADRYKLLCKAAREKALKNFNYSVIARKYINVYQQAIDMHKYV